MLFNFTFFFLPFIFGCAPDTVLFSPDQDNQQTEFTDFSYRIPAGGNSWVLNNITQNEQLINNNGIHNWQSADDVIRTYFWTNQSGNLQVGLNIKVPDNNSLIKISVGGESKEIQVSNTNFQDIEVGNFNLESAGYHFIEIQGIEKASDSFGEIQEVLIGGSAVSGEVHFIENEEDFYFGRRGPSIHLSYALPENKDFTWYYNEITVPEGEDVIGSYFMSNGFGEGYFGIQVNSESERRVLFSVWSPYVTDNPGEIPEDYQVQLLGYGDGVTINAFGGEGSGGQSYLKYNWVAGNTYKFLLKGEPAGNNSTDFTAYFFAPEVGEWKLIASFRRPYTNTYLTRFHSFLENFNTKTGNISRKAFYDNQWAFDSDGKWNELTKAKFTADATGRKKVRLDFTGGVENEAFYLQNCGFIKDHTAPDVYFERATKGNAPNIDFTQLEVPEVPEPVEHEYLDKSNWEILAFSSEETSGEGTNGLASLIIDNDYSTYWHSCWTTCEKEFSYPHLIKIDLKESKSVKGLTIVQRNGSRKIKEFEILGSTDGENWESIGNFSLDNSANPQDFNFPTQVSLKYFRFKPISSHDGNRFAALAEISLYQ